MIFLTRLLGFVMLVAVTFPAPAKDLPTARAEDVGMSTERLTRITGLARRYVDEGKLAGSVTMVARHGKVVHYEAVGKRNLETGAPMTRDTLSAFTR
jgi:hypothetical protein